MFNQDITIINKVQSGYKCTNIKGFWSSNDGISINNVDLVKSDGYKCYILRSTEGYVNPNEFIETGWTLRNDDYIVKGSLQNLSKAADLSSYEHMKITNVSNKDYGSSNMQHFEVIGI